MLATYTVKNILAIIATARTKITTTINSKLQITIDNNNKINNISLTITLIIDDISDNINRERERITRR